jgi:hypothetical protein
MRPGTGGNTAEPRLIGREESAAYLNITTKSLHRLVQRGLLTPIQLPGFRRILFDKLDLDELITANKGGPASGRG